MKREIKIGELVEGEIYYSTHVDGFIKTPAKNRFTAGSYIINNILGDFVFFGALLTSIAELKRVGYVIPGEKPKTLKKAFETFTFTKDGITRDITIAIIYDGIRPRAGYSVRNEGDEQDAEIARKIAIGRAESDKTNLIPTTEEYSLNPQYGNNKSILIAIAKGIRRDIEKGNLIIKGIRKNK